MGNPEILKREIHVLVFDQYGTIVDMQKGLAEIAAPFLKKKGWDGEAHRFVTWWRRTHYENSMIDALCDRGHTLYRQIGHRAASHVMDRCGIEYSQDEVRWLVLKSRNSNHSRTSSRCYTNLEVLATSWSSYRTVTATC